MKRNIPSKYLKAIIICVTNCGNHPNTGQHFELYVLSLH